MKKHYIKTQVPVEKKTLFGKKTVYEGKIVQVDDAAWEKYRADHEALFAGRDDKEGFTLEEMIFYDELFDDDW